MIQEDSLSKELHAGPMLHEKIIQCSRCGYAHWYPLPDASTVARYYEDDQFYSQHSPPDWFLKEKWEHEQGYWQAYYEYLYRLMEIKFMSGWRDDLPVIDYGCGSGRVIYYLHQHCGYHVSGYEPSLVARKWSPDPTRIVSIPDKIPFKYGGHVILNLVLEHILDPETFLREQIIPHLHSDGHLIVVVPNEFNRLQRWVGGDWFVSPVHLNYFSRESLRGLLERVGLKIVFEGGTFPTELWLMIPGLDHRNNPKVGRRTHLWRLKLEKRSPWIFHVYGWLMRRWGIGREVIMICEKR